MSLYILEDCRYSSDDVEDRLVSFGFLYIAFVCLPASALRTCVILAVWLVGVWSGSVGRCVGGLLGATAARRAKQEESE